MKTYIIALVSAVAAMATALSSPVNVQMEGSGTDAGAFTSPKVLQSPTNKAGIRSAVMGSGSLAPGVYVVVASGSGVTRILNVTGAAITIANGSGVGGNPTFSAHPKLESIAGLTLTSGMVLMSTGSNGFTGTNKIALSGTANFATSSGTANFAEYGKTTGSPLIIADPGTGWYLTTDDGSGDPLHIAYADGAKIGQISSAVLAVNIGGYVQADDGGGFLQVQFADASGTANSATFAGYGINSNHPVAIVQDDGYVYDDTNLGNKANAGMADTSFSTQTGYLTGQVVAVNAGSDYVVDDNGTPLSTHNADVAGSASAGTVSGNELVVVDGGGSIQGDNGTGITVQAHALLKEDDDTLVISVDPSNHWQGRVARLGTTSETIVTDEWGNAQWLRRNNSSLVQVFNTTATLVSGTAKIIDSTINTNTVPLTPGITTLAGSGQIAYTVQVFSGSMLIKGSPGDTSTLNVGWFADN